MQDSGHLTTLKRPMETDLNFQEMALVVVLNGGGAKSIVGGYDSLRQLVWGIDTARPTAGCDGD